MPHPFKGLNDKEAAEVQAKRTINKKDVRMRVYKPPTTSDEWWSNVEIWWPEIKSLILSYSRTNLSGDELNGILGARSPVMEDLIHRAWDGAPDVGSIHGIPGWNVLCDLCSECNVLRTAPAKPRKVQ